MSAPRHPPMHTTPMIPPPPPPPPAMPCSSGLTASQSTAGPLETLEQRIYDLLAPFREADIGVDGDENIPSRQSECRALILCENIAFLIRHNQASYGKCVEPNDITFAARKWNVNVLGNGYVGIGVFVNGNGFTHTVLRANMGKNEDVIGKLSERVDELLQPFFPGL